MALDRGSLIRDRIQPEIVIGAGAVELAAVGADMRFDVLMFHRWGSNLREAGGTVDRLPHNLASGPNPSPRALDPFARRFR